LELVKFFFDGHPVETCLLVAIVALAVLSAAGIAVRAWDCWLRRRGRGHVIVEDHRHPGTEAPELQFRSNGDVVMILRDPPSVYPPQEPTTWLRCGRWRPATARLLPAIELKSGHRRPARAA
jgi:hypothetical protein